MPKLEPNIFVDLVLRSGLVTDEQLAKTLAGLEEPPSDSGIVCSSLINAGLLTPWQSEQLLAGRYQGFFLGKYKMLDKLGSGGMSSVYLAEHLEMGRRVAIKVLTGRMAERPEYLDRFKYEARAAARVDHPNVVRAYDVGHEGNIHYLVMEYIQGTDLQKIVNEKGPLEARVAADYIRQAAVGLAHVHEAGMIHRDIKPANFLVDNQGVVKILDLGLARVEEETRMSLEGGGEQVLGTADYLAPEQSLDSHNVTPRADIYSLGCSLYFLLTGQPPFPSGTLAQRIMMHRSKEPTNLFELRPDVPPALVAVCQKMMAKSPDDRYQTAGEVAEILQSWLDGKASRLLAMMAVRPTQAQPAKPSGASDDEELTLAPLDDEPKADARPRRPDSTPPKVAEQGKASKDAAGGATEAASESPSQEPAKASLQVAPKGATASVKAADTRSSSAVEPAQAPSKIATEAERIESLLDDVLPTDMPADGPLSPHMLGTQRSGRYSSNEVFPKWLLVVAGVAVTVAVGLLMWVIIASAS